LYTKRSSFNLCIQTYRDLLDARYLSKFRRLFAKTYEGNRKLLMYLAPENARNEVSSNGGKQLIPPDGV